jgi:glyoxylase-like metal-dependent hydrolase (beta-lactamase superfamily II)
VDDPLQRRDIALLRADNPGPFTLDGTNTWLVGRDPCWIVDPGPAQSAHVAAVLAEAARRGGIGGIALTHDHDDHAGAAIAVRDGAGGLAGAGAGAATAAHRPAIGAARRPGAGAALAGDAPGPPHVLAGGDACGPPHVLAGGDACGLPHVLADGDAFGPLRVLATPGHATDHLAFVFEDVCFTGDAVLAQSSVFVAPDPGALRAYLAALERLRTLDLALLCTGHGPPVTDPAALLDRYLAHRRDRERRLVAALADGLRATGELLDRVWDDAPPSLRLAATATLAAHLDKLDEDGLLPADVERPPWPPPGGLRPVV